MKTNYLILSTLFLASSISAEKSGNWATCAQSSDCKSTGWICCDASHTTTSLVVGKKTQTAKICTDPAQNGTVPLDQGGNYAGWGYVCTHVAHK